jgi:hypothetical protein
MIISIPHGGFINIDDDLYWSLSDQKLQELEDKIKMGFYDLDDTDPLYSKRTTEEDLDLNLFEE